MRVIAARLVKRGQQLQLQDIELPAPAKGRFSWTPPIYDSAD
jgi:hypothetical protein